MTKTELIKLTAHAYDETILKQWDMEKDCPIVGIVQDPLGIMLIKAASQTYQAGLPDLEQVKRVQDRLAEIRHTIVTTEMDMLQVLALTQE